ncbi:hypothetical protein ABIE71_002214 [Bradyrhizobium diazoefficiens]
MRTALYFPHTEIRSQHLLKTSLLLWDKVEFIVPDPNYVPYYADATVARAIELIGVQHYPTEEEKQETHDLVEDLATRTLPDAFYYRPDVTHGSYEIYPQKFLNTTWKILEELQLAGAPLPNADYPLTTTAGLSVMSILADCCAGETRARITDRGMAYATITNLLVDTSKQDAGSFYERIIPLTLKLIDATSLPLDSLIKFREREEKESGGHTLRKLRHTYLQRIEDHVNALQKLTRPADRAELDRTFETDMADDLRRLEGELGSEKRGLAYSKEIIVSALAAAGTIWGATHGLPLEIPAAFTALGGPVTVGGILSSQNKYAAARRAIMEKHPMSYLYQLQNMH